MIQMHRLIMDAKPGQMIDHINGDGLDNQRRNLWFCTPRDNARNNKHARVEIMEIDKQFGLSADDYRPPNYPDRAERTRTKGGKRSA